VCTTAGHAYHDSFRILLADSCARHPSQPLKYLFLKDLAGNQPKNRPGMRSNSLIYKYLTPKSLFLKDLAEIKPQVFDFQRPHQGGLTTCVALVGASMPFLRANL
jgi:hypothetical protein